MLESYDYLYTDIRNKLVHEGKGFYELGGDNGSISCEKLWVIYKDIVSLILSKNFSTIDELHKFAENILKQDSFTGVIATVVTKSGKPKKIELPKW